MRMFVFLLGALSMTCFAPSAFAVDLTKIDRTIRKEPAYRTKPRYALLVLGPKAETRIWLVIDHKTLYVDRNGNGDLTEKGEHVSAEKTESTDYLYFRAGAFLEADGKTKHSDLTVSQYFARQFGYLVNTVAVMDILGTRAQTTNGEDGCSFADTPKDAPVIHINGPLTLRVHGGVIDSGAGRTARKAVPSVLKPGEKISRLQWIDFMAEPGPKAVPITLKPREIVSQLFVQVGTPGLGRGTFAALAVEKAEWFPADLYPSVEIIVPSKTDPKETIKAEFLLKERASTHFYGPVQVPEAAGEGNAKVTLSFPDWKDGRVAPAVVELPIIGAPAAK